MPSGITVAIIADDLTGACDNAVQFTVRGARAMVSLHPLPTSPAADVLALSTDSRDLPTASAEARLREATAHAANANPRFILKKIDSTLRGNPGAEIACVADALACDTVLIAPAFSAMGRTVSGGLLRVSGPAHFKPIDVAALLRSQGLSGCVPVRPGTLGNGAQFLVVDAASQADLDAVVVEALAWRRRVLWAGSAGLGMAFSRRAF